MSAADARGQPEAAARVRALASDDCLAECRLLAAVDHAGAPLAYRRSDGRPPCPACRAAIEQRRGPQRIEAPRRPRRGDTPRARATWEEALAWVTEALRRSSEGGDRRLVWISLARRPRLLDAVPRRVTGLVDGGIWVRWLPPVEMAARAAAATGPSVAGGPGDADGERPDAVIVWGADPEGGLPAGDAREAVEGGAPLLTVDPRPTAAARRSAVHLPLRPGTDVALAAALAHSIAPEAGTEDWARPWPPGRAAPVCAVPEAALRSAAELIAGARRPMLVVGGGIAWHGPARPAAAALARLAEHAGAATVWPQPAPDPAAGLEAPLGAPAPREVACLDGVLEDVRAELVVLEGAAELRPRPGGAALSQWLSDAKRVLVLADRWGSLPASADLVLPVPSPLERTGVIGLRHPAEPWVARTAAERPRDLPEPWRMWRGLARRAGWPEGWFELDVDRWARGGAEDRSGVPEGADAAPPGGADTTHEEVGEGPRSTPAVAESYPLQAVVGVPPQPRELAETAAGPWDRVILAGEEAERRGLVPGDRVLVFGRRGAIEARLEVAAGLAAGTVALPPGGAGLLSGLNGGLAVGGALVEVARADS